MVSMESTMLLRSAACPRLLMAQQRPHASMRLLASQAQSLRVRLRVGAVCVSSPSASAAAASAGVGRQAVQEVSLESELGVSYEPLRDMLAAGDWEAADAETRGLLCVLAGEGAEKRKWVYFSEVQFIPEVDLRTVDGLWRAYSDNKFGYSVQRRVWKNSNKSWTTFFCKVGWTRHMVDSRNDAYKKFPLEFMWDVAEPTPVGHLPLTNALRGTQLLEKLLEHPAFDFAEEEEENLLLPDTEGVIPSAVPQRSPVQQPQQRRVIPDDMTVDYGF